MARRNGLIGQSPGDMPQNGNGDMFCRTVVAAVAAAIALALCRLVKRLKDGLS